MSTFTPAPGEPSSAGHAPATAVRAYVRDHAGRLLADLDAWLRIPSISADPAHANDVRASAEWLAAAFTRAGVPTVEIWETAGHPAVYAEWPATDPAAPVVVVYGHHDVQPADPEELWSHPPFEPTLTGDELGGRGAIDDKGQVAFHLLALTALSDLTGASAPPVTLKFLIEGEEESGSPHFADLLTEHRERLAADVAIVSDTSVFARDCPTLCTGMRGLVTAQIDARGPATDLHSGSFGGAVPNPATALARVLAGLHDDNGRVTLPGFYDRVRALTERERELFARLPFDEGVFLRTAASTAPYGEVGFTTPERLWARPTAEVNGIWGGYQGPGSKTIIPSEAHAKVSFRLVADQRPEDVRQALVAYVENAAPQGVSMSVTFDGAGVRPCLTPLDDPTLRAAAGAMSRAFDGADVLFTREGGSGPEADLAEILDVPVVFFGFGLPDDRIHAPNERVVVPMLLAGAEATVYLWAAMGGVSL